MKFLKCVSFPFFSTLFFYVQDSANLVVERRDERPATMNAFELISTSQGLNLGILFEKQMVPFLVDFIFSFSIDSGLFIFLLKKLLFSMNSLGIRLWTLKFLCWSLSSTANKMREKMFLLFCSSIFLLSACLNECIHVLCHFKFLVVEFVLCCYRLLYLVLSA